MTDLRENKKQRLASSSVLIFTPKIVFDVAKKTSFKKVFITDEKLDLKKITAEKIFLLSEDAMKKITGLSSCEKGQIAAEAPLPENVKIPSQKINRLLILDGLQDPANVGTLIRTAHAMGWEGVAFLPNTADPFQSKALRAAMGSTFFLPLYFPAQEELKTFLIQEKFSAYLADLSGKSIKELKPQPPFALILSSEGQGPKSWTHKIAQKITIPMNAEIDSLNVAAAGAILMYNL